MGLEWATEADVKLVHKKPVSRTAKRGTSLHNVADVIAVTSCKVGGTIANRWLVFDQHIFAL